MSSGAACPIPTSRLQAIASNSCTDALSLVTSYNHTLVSGWNGKIINSILSQLAHATAAAPAVQDQEGEEKPKAQRQFKYAVTSTIIEHLDASPSVPGPNTTTTTSTSTSTEQVASPPATPQGLGAAETAAEEAAATPAAGAGSDERAPAPAVGGSSAGVAPAQGRRGMHSATGAYWNNDTDGMWSYKWEGGDKNGMDVVISVIWVAVN